MIGAEVPGTPEIRRLAVIGDLAAGRRHHGGAQRLGVDHEDADRRLAVPGLDEAFVDREGTDAGENVAAGRRGVDPASFTTTWANR